MQFEHHRLPSAGDLVQHQKSHSDAARAHDGHDVDRFQPARPQPVTLDTSSVWGLERCAPAYVFAITCGQNGRVHGLFGHQGRIGRALYFAFAYGPTSGFPWVSFNGPSSLATPRAIAAVSLAF